MFILESGDLVRFKPDRIPELFSLYYGLTVTSEWIFTIRSVDSKTFVVLEPPDCLPERRREEWLKDYWGIDRFELPDNVKSLKSLCLKK